VCMAGQVTEIITPFNSLELLTQLAPFDTPLEATQDANFSTA
jgi:hypothetical protein